jgi:DNA mismatch repair protein MutS2
VWQIDDRSLRVLEWPELVNLWSAKARSQRAKDRVLNMTPALFGFEVALRRQQATLELVGLKSSLALELPVGETPDVEPTLLRIQKQATMSLEEFASLVRFQKAAQGLSHFLKRYAQQFPSLQNLLGSVDLLEAWSEKFFRLLTPQGDLVDHASEDLFALRGLVRDLHEKIRKRLEDYLSNPKLTEMIQDTYVTVRDGRYVLPIKTNFRGRVGGIVHDVSNSEQTLFVEPQEVVEWNNQLKVAEKEIEREIERILGEISFETRPVADSLQKNLDLLTTADELQAAARLASSWRSPLTALERGTELRFDRIAHPLLCLQKEMVSNSVQWEAAFVLTGPNAGGKTVLLKSVGLALAMSGCGLPIPALRVSVPEDLERVEVDIGDDQDLAKNLSTFSGHLTVLRNFLEHADSKTLVLVDEIATGTSPEEGQPLAQAFVESWLDRGAKVFITTHYGGLKTFAMVDPRCRIASMGMDPKTRSPSFEVVMDLPGESSAFEMAEQLGLPSSLISRARKLRGETPRELAQVLQKFERAREELMEQKRSLETQTLAAKKREELAADRLLELDRKAREGLAMEAKRILKELESERAELLEKIRAVRTDSEAAEAQKRLGEVSDKLRDIMAEARPAAAGRSFPLLDHEFVVDAPVDVEGLGLGVITELPKEGPSHPKALFGVRVGGMTTRVSRSALKRPAKDQLTRFEQMRIAERDRSKRQGTQMITKSRSSGSRVCDVRGRNVEDALMRVEKAVDDVLRQDDVVLTIIHGHGTGRLKEAIRSYLVKLQQDLEFRSGTWPGEGDDGVTVVEKSKG